MKLRKLEVSNFKCFKETSIEFANLTLLTGANSSGKSSILHSILCPIQSNKFPLELSLNGAKVDLGDFENTVFKNYSNNTIGLDYTLEISNNRNIRIKTEWNCEAKRKIPILFYLNVISDYYQIEIKRKEKYDVSIVYNKEKDLFDTNFDDDLKLKISELLNMMEERTGSTSDLFQSSEPKLHFQMEQISDINENISHWEHYRMLNEVLNVFDSFNDQSNFISSFRMRPERTYYDNSTSDLKVKRDGSGYIDQIVNWETNNSKQYQSLIEIMNRLTLLHDIQIKRMSGGRFEVNVRTGKESVSSTLNDVGFGISQLLPIIVADLQLDENSTLVVAQPEIHLHPSVQALFGDYIIDSVQNSNKSYILETHSEYIINRIRLRLAEKKLKKEDVSTYYFENDGQESKTFKVDFKSNGEILGAPETFFNTYMLDVMNIAINS